MDFMYSEITSRCVSRGSLNTQNFPWCFVATAITCHPTAGQQVHFYVFDEVLKLLHGGYLGTGWVHRAGHGVLLYYPLVI